MEEFFSQFLTPVARNVARAASPAVPLPSPRVAVNVRLAVADDLGFIDELQKMHSHMVGFMPRKQLEKYVSDEWVLIAEEGVGGQGTVGSGQGTVNSSQFTVDSGQGAEAARDNRKPSAVNCKPSTENCKPATPLGYIIFRDQYLKRDDVGIIYQLNVAPLKQRHLIGASLVQAAFERAAYGCKLFCCWCAQDIQANYFWERIGFTPLAFRTGSRRKQRIHIFWQKRIRPPEVDPGPNRHGEPVAGGTPWWYPYQTSGGAVAEDRLVLPIPPGAHWRDVKPVVLPGEVPSAEERGLNEGKKPTALPGGAPVSPRPEESRIKLTTAQRAAIARMQSAELGGVPLGKKAVITGGGVKYVERTDFVPELDVPEELREALDPEAAKKKAKKAARPKRQRPKHEKKLVAAARELRDRYLDAVNSGRVLLGEAREAKYDVARQLAAGDDGAMQQRSGVVIRGELEGQVCEQRENARVVDGERYRDAA